MLFSFFSTGVLRRSRRPAVQQRESPAWTQEEESGQSAHAGASTTANDAWPIYKDQHGRPFLWNSTTGDAAYQIYNGAPGYYGQPPAPTVYTRAGFLPSPTLLASPGPAGHHGHGTPWGPVLVPVVVAPSGSEGREEEAEKIKPPKAQGMWQEYYNDGGKTVWIHSGTGNFTEIDPYE